MVVPLDLLSDREFATVFWLALLGLAVIALAIRKADVRTSLGHLLKLRLPPELPLLVVLFAVWMALAVGLASLLGFRNGDPTKDTSYGSSYLAWACSPVWARWVRNVS